MYKKLVRHGNSNALVLDKPILELLNISEETLLKITTNGISLTITPISLTEDKDLTLAYDHMLKPIDTLDNCYAEVISGDSKSNQLKESRLAKNKNAITFVAARKEAIVV